MLLQGYFNPAHVLREFFSSEYAFSVQWYDQLEIRIAHCRGIWYLTKIVKGKVQDYFEMGDNWHLWEHTNPLLKGFIQAEQEIHDRKGWAERAVIAKVLTNVLMVWGDKLDAITTINIVQPGRNALLDRLTGEFDLSPQVDSWKS